MLTGIDFHHVFVLNVLSPNGLFTEKLPSLESYQPGFFVHRRPLSTFAKIAVYSILCAVYSELSTLRLANVCSLSMSFEMNEVQLLYLHATRYFKNLFIEHIEYFPLILISTTKSAKNHIVCNR